MTYKIRDADGLIYEFKTAEALLEALRNALGTEHEYYWRGEWY
jgi:hypothetical protein